MQGLDILDALTHYRGQIESLELTHFIYIYSLKNLNIEKDSAMALVNGLLGFCFATIILNYFKYSPWLIIIIISNYYLLALFFTLERLKFGILFLVIGIIVNKKYILSNLFLLLSLMSHLSMIIPITVWMFSKYINKYAKDNFNYINLIKLLTIVIFIILLARFYENQLLAKVEPYLLVKTNFEIIESSAKTLIFLLLSIFVHGKLSFIKLLIFTPLIVFSGIIEPARLNLFAFIFFIYFCYTAKNKIKAKYTLLFVLFYYSFTGYKYIDMIIFTGG